MQKLKTVTSTTYEDTQPWPSSVKRRIELLSKKDHKGVYDRLPRSLTSQESSCSKALLTELLRSHIPVTPAECADIMASVLPFYWETSLDRQTLAQQQLLWYEVLKYHSHKTLSIVAMEWLKNAKRKPTPADFLELAEEADDAPQRILRLQKLTELPVLEVIVNQVPNEEKFMGCPIILCKLVQQATAKNIPYGERQQENYLSTGVLPDWYVPNEETKVEGLPTRDELLATMSVEARAAAVDKHQRT